MILLVDIGNSRIKWECREGGYLSAEGNTLRTSQGLDQAFETMWVDLAPRRVVVSNVAGEEVAARLTSWCGERWAVMPQFVRTQAEGYGVRNGYEDYRQLGVDRWLALIAAWRRYQDSVCVVDCGTAVTLDALSSSGEHLGGMIMPGLSLMRSSLLRHTKGIRTEDKGRVTPLAFNTRDGVTAGSVYAVAGGVDRFVFELKAHLDEVRCIITGGDAEYLLSFLTNRFEPIRNLVLQGLAIVAGDKEVP
jgi:type III pantothenate kinase